MKPPAMAASDSIKMGLGDDLTASAATSFAGSASVVLLWADFMTYNAINAPERNIPAITKQATIIPKASDNTMVTAASKKAAETTLQRTVASKSLAIFFVCCILDFAAPFATAAVRVPILICASGHR